MLICKTNLLILLKLLRNKVQYQYGQNQSLFYKLNQHNFKQNLQQISTHLNKSIQTISSWIFCFFSLSLKALNTNCHAFFKERLEKSSKFRSLRIILDRNLHLQWNLYFEEFLSNSINQLRQESKAKIAKDLDNKDESDQEEDNLENKKKLSQKKTTQEQIFNMITIFQSFGLKQRAENKNYKNIPMVKRRINGPEEFKRGQCNTYRATKVSQHK